MKQLERDVPETTPERPARPSKTPTPAQPAKRPSIEDAEEIAKLIVARGGLTVSEIERVLGMRSGDDNGDRRPPGMKKETKSLAEMLSDSFREAALLIAVFGWLDKAVHNEAFWAGRWGWEIIAAAVVLYVAGWFLEWTRGRP